ncbi:MAG: phage major capsid protein [Gemmatales bacterium]|nr:phage major capsid protein [Gemmatales bacterium]MDW8175132.1 phage major capsid protein [Gemmatales bacterium]
MTALSLKELRHERRQVAEKMRDLANKVYAEARKFSAEEEEEWQRLNQRYQELAEKIQRLQSLGTDIPEFSPPVPRPVPASIRESARESSAHAWREALRFWIRYRLHGTISDRESALCRRAGIDLSKRELVARLPSDYETRVMKVTPGTAGGYTIPQEFSYELEVALRETGRIRRIARILRTGTGADLVWPLADDLAQKATIVGEATAVTPADATVGQVVFKAFKFATAVHISNELLEDEQVDLASELARWLAERMNRGTEEMYLQGNGTTQPQGIAKAAATGHTTSGPNAITSDDVLDLIYSVDPIYRRNAVFVMSDQVLAAIRKLKDTTGRYLVDAVRSVDDDETLETIFGYPVYVNPYMDGFGNNKTLILFGDFSRFVIRDVNEVRIVPLSERFAEQDVFAIYMFFRTDSRYLNAGSHPIKALRTPSGS